MEARENHAQARGARGALREAAFVCLLATVFGALLLGGAFRDFDRHGGKDWASVLGQTEAELTTLRDYGQLPLWNPWRAGGQPSLAQPVSMLLSPVLPVAMLVGVVPAFKLLLLPLFITGFLGAWLLAGHLGLRGVARLVPPLVFYGSSLFPLYLSGGLPNWLCAMALLPWLFWFHRRAVDDARFVVGTALAWAALLLCGAVDRFMFLPVLLALDAGCLAVSGRGLRPLATVGMALLLGAVLGAVRVIPVFEVYLQYPRAMEAATRHIPLDLLPRLLLGTDLPDLVTRDGAFVPAGDGLVYWINAGAYVGPMALLLTCAGVALRWRAAWILALLGFAMTWLALGVSVQPSLWSLLNALPVLGSLRGPERLMMFVVFFLALLAGFGFQAIDAFAVRRWGASAAVRRTGVVVVLGALAVPLLVVNAPISGSAFVVEPPSGLRSGGWFAPRAERPPFRQSVVPKNAFQFGAPHWPSVVRNQGNVLAGVNIRMQRAAVPFESDRYSGEVFLAEGRGRVDADITPNQIRIVAQLEAPDRVVVNQNWYPGWRARGDVDGEVEAWRGLISLALPAGSHTFTLAFRPGSVALGAAVSLLGVVAAIFYYRTVSRRRSIG